MVLSIAPSPSNCWSSSDARNATEMNCKFMERMSNTTVLDNDSKKSSASVLDLVTSTNSSNETATFISSRHSPNELQQSIVGEVGVEMDSEDDDYSDSSSIDSDSSSNSDTSSVLSVMNELDSLNERRRAMLDLSISKIQTMNTSNVAVSLRKSLLIYNTMKSLQRDLDSCGVYMCDSLTERGNGVVASDVEMLEDEVEEDDWEQSVSDLEIGKTGGIICRQQHLGYGWPWGTSEFSVNSSNDTIQEMEKYGCGEMFALTSCDGLFNSGSIWSNANQTDSSVFIDDYLGMWGAWEDENYNPLTNCNLTQTEIMNMFRLPAYHLNNQLVSQA